MDPPLPRTKQTGANTRSWTGAALLTLLIAAHLGLVLSLALQPLGVHARPAAERSILWGLFHDAVHRDGPGADFFAVYTAGEAVAQGRSPYWPDSARQRAPYGFPFRYLPLVAQTLGRALAQLEPRPAYLVWIGVLELLLALCLIRLWPRLPRGWPRYLGAAAALLSAPYLLELHMGQFTFAALALATLALTGLPAAAASTASVGARAGHGLLLGVAMLLKLFPLALLPALVRTRRGWPLAAAALALVLLGLAPLLFDAANTQTFLERNVTSPGGGMDAGNFGLACALTQAQADPLQTAWLKWWHLALIGFTTAAVLLSRRAGVLLGAAALVLAHFCGYVHVWEHHYSGLVLVGLWIMVALAEDAPSSRAALAAAAVLVCLLALPTPYTLLDLAKDPHMPDVAADWSLGRRLLLNGSKALPCAALYLLCMARLLGGGVALPWVARSVPAAEDRRQ